MPKTIHDLLVGNLWQPRPEQIKNLRNKFQLPMPELNSLKSTLTNTHTNLEVTLTTHAMIHQTLSPAMDKPKQVHLIDANTHSPQPKISTKIAQIIKPSESISVQNTLTNKTLINDWHTLRNTATNCEECNLWQHRTHVVIERGNHQAKWMFISDWPSEHDDLQGKSMQGNSGELLDKMIVAMKLDIENDVYITNIVKCRPSGKRKPTIDEIHRCSNYLLSQINLVKPRIIITLGSDAAQTLLKLTTAINKLRQQVHYYQNIPLIVTYHPADLLRTPHLKQGAWEDLQLALKTFKQLDE